MSVDAIGLSNRADQTAVMLTAFTQMRLDFSDLFTVITSNALPATQNVFAALLQDQGNMLNKDTTRSEPIPLVPLAFPPNNFLGRFWSPVRYLLAKKRSLPRPNHLPASEPARGALVRSNINAQNAATR